MTGRRRSRRKIAVRVILLAATCALGYAGFTVYPTIRDLVHSGFFASYGDRKYNGDTSTDLKAIWTALDLYQKSEGQFPEAAGWMDAIQKRIRTDDMPGSEAAKKLVDPAYAGQPDKYGFAFNDAASAKYVGDIKDPKMPLVFESQDPSKNAHGDPLKLAPKPPHPGGNLAIAVDGTILRLGD